jgi:hypothetical protein
MIDVLEIIKDELDECVALLRPHYPADDDDTLRERAVGWRQSRYAKGRWPTDEEIETRKAKEAAEKAKEAAARAAAEKEAAETWAAE